MLLSTPADKHLVQHALSQLSNVYWGKIHPLGPPVRLPLERAARYEWVYLHLDRWERKTCPFPLIPPQNIRKSWQAVQLP